MLRNRNEHLPPAEQPSDEYQQWVLPQWSQVRRGVDASRFQQAFALAECALADSIEDEIVRLLIVCEVIDGVVDDSVGTQAFDQCEVLGMQTAVTNAPALFAS
jgi:hypothetical protein